MNIRITHVDLRLKIRHLNDLLARRGNPLRYELEARQEGRRHIYTLMSNQRPASTGLEGSPREIYQALHAMIHTWEQRPPAAPTMSAAEQSAARWAAIAILTNQHLYTLPIVDNARRLGEWVERHYPTAYSQPQTPTQEDPPCAPPNPN